ncbi:UDP-N-acetylmuramate--L-alanine ligase [Microbaculum sp. FT89]|uniref:UDP-N-acetylmuramate--L-alanine ligase n=1 Tax=Microbaculum sp. FT89 TaxID=3447298 RepID=UPI003F53BC1C
MRPPRETGPIHFVGIGGIGMSGIAELLADLGYTVQGSDQAESANVERLRSRGVTVTVGHAAENVGPAAVVVISTAVKPDNPELVAARARHIPVIRRAEMLAELMRGKRGISLAGTHGKTTTTTIMATLLEGAGYDPTVVNGGIINAWGTNARLGQSDWFIIEADESDGTFLKYPNEIALVSNIDAEHLDHWHSFDALKQGFRDFVMNLPFYGFAALCIDHPTVRAVAGGITDRTVVTYGESADADARLVDFSHDSGGTRFSVEITDRVSGAIDRISDIRLPMPGHHNALNATGAIAIARRIGIAGEAIVAALAGFEGVKRRFTFTGEWNGVRIYDDYGHHPVEIAAVLKAARGAVEDSTGPESKKPGRVIAIMQPHRYTRLSDLFDQFAGCFGEADTLYVADVYAAGEDPIEGADRDALVAAIRARGHTDARALAGPDVLAAEIAAIARPGDLVIFLGAGSITQWAHALPQQLKTNPEGVSA